MIPKDCKRLAEVDFQIAVVRKHTATVTGFMLLRAVSQRQFFRSRSKTLPVSRSMKSRKWITTACP